MVSTEPATGTAGPTRPRTPWPVALAVVATIAATGFALWDLGGPALTYDEGYTIGVVRQPFAVTWDRITSFDLVQAPYYLLFYGWYRLGESEWLMRLPSVAFFVASLPLLYASGRRLVDARVGAVAAALAGLNGLALAWAQNARAYTLILFLAAALTYLLVRAVDRPASRGLAVAYAAVAVVAVYAQFLMGLVVAAQLVSLLALRPVPRRLLVTAGGLIAAAVVPAAVWVATLDSDPLESIREPSFRYLLHMLGDVAGGGRLQFFVIGALAAVGAATAMAASVQRPGTRTAWARLMPVLWLVLPVLTLVVVTYTAKPLLQPRYLMIAVPAFAMVAAIGVVAVLDHRPRLGRLALGAVLVAGLVGAVTHDTVDETQDWRAATAVVTTSARPGEVLVVNPSGARPVVDYYQRRLDGPEVPTLVPQLDDPPGGTALWVIEQRIRPQDPRAWNPMPDFEAWRDRHFELAETHPVILGITVYRYELRQP